MLKLLLGNLGKFYDVFTKGKEVVNAAKGKNKFLLKTALYGALSGAVVIYRSTGHELPISDSDLADIAGTVATFYCLYAVGSTVATTDKIGLPPRKQSDADSDPIVNTELPAIPAPAAPASLPPDPHTAARVGENFVDSENPIAGLDTTYIG